MSAFVSIQSMYCVRYCVHVVLYVQLLGLCALFRGEVKSECWLVLTESSLSCFDRHPAGITRKPLSSFCWTDPQNLVVVLRRVHAPPSPYMSPSRNQHLFAVEQHSASGVKHSVFVTDTLREKQEWVEAVESAITRNSGVLAGDPSDTPAAPPRSGVVVTPVSRTKRSAVRHRPASTACAASSSPDSSAV